MYHATPGLQIIQKLRFCCQNTKRLYFSARTLVLNYSFRPKLNQDLKFGFKPKLRLTSVLAKSFSARSKRKVKWFG